MKKYVLTLLLVLFSRVLFAQYSENFNAVATPALPTGWTVNSGSPDTFYDVTGLSNVLRLNAQNEAAATPVITNPGDLTFYYKVSSLSRATTLTVQATDGTNTVNVWTRNITATTASYQLVTVNNLFDNITINPANFKLKFVIGNWSTGTDIIYIDNISVTNVPITNGTIGLEEGFEGAFPASGWTNTNCTLGNVPRSGYKSLNFDANGDTYVTTNTLASASKMTFAYLNEAYDTRTTNLVVEILTPSNTVYATSNVTINANFFSNIFTVNLASYYNFKIRFRDNTAAATLHSAYIDDITIVPKSQTDINVETFDHKIYNDDSVILADNLTDYFRRNTYATDGYGYWDGAYKIMNVGSGNLNLGTITITGDGAKNFSIIGVDPSNTAVTAGNYKYVSVRYDPKYAGFHNATINIPSNDPDEPVYKINIKGYGIDCEYPLVTIAENTFENIGSETMNFTEVTNSLLGVSNNFTTNANIGLPLNSGTSYYPRNVPMVAGGTKTWSIVNKATALEFGPVDVTGKKGIVVSLEMAGFSPSSSPPYYDSSTNTTVSTNSGGLDPDDRIELYISTDNGVTWSKEVYLESANRTSTENNSVYPFSTAADHTFVMDYDGNNAQLLWGNSQSVNDMIGYFMLDLPDDKTINSIMIRLIGRTNRSDEILLVDNVKVSYRGIPRTKTWYGPSVGWKDEMGSASSKSTYIQKVIFAEDYDSSAHSGDIEACKCDIAAGKTVIIKGNNYMKIESDIMNDGTLNIESDANLIQVSKKGTYTGTNPTAIVKRNANLKIRDYNYWGTPVSDANKLQAFSPSTLSTNFYTYNESNDYFVRIASPSTTDFVVGKGYAIRAPNTFTTTPAIFNGQFLGKPNNGDVSVPLVYTDAAHGYNLISNPYPSTIDSYLLYQTNSSLIYNTFYLWTNTNYNPKMQGSNYPTNLPSGTQIINNYAVINGTGGLGAPYGFSGTGTNAPAAIPNQFIKVGQGFIVKAKSAGSLLFENEIRSHDNSAVFFNRMANGTKNQKTTAATKDRYWINLKTPLDFVTPLLVGYINGATDSYEMDYDAELFIDAGDSFYTILDDKKLGIQGRKYPLNKNDIIDLGARFGLQGNYEISLDKKEGIFANGQDIFLKDKVTGIVTNLSQSSYSFTADSGEVKDRFQISYDYRTLGTDVPKDKKEPTIYKEGNYFVLSANENIKTVKIYDASGRLMTQQIANSKDYKINMAQYQSGVYIIDITTSSKHYNKKVIK